MYGYFVNILTSKTLAVPIFQGDKASAYFSPFILKHTHIYIIYINCRCSPQSRKLVSFPANGMTVKAIVLTGNSPLARTAHITKCALSIQSAAASSFYSCFTPVFLLNLPPTHFFWTACLLSFDGLLAFCFWSSSRTLINDKVPGLAWPERQRKNAPKCGKLRRRCKEKLPRGSRAGCRSKRAIFLCYKLNAAVFVP